MKNPSPTRRERVQQRERAIVAAAHEVFMERGFDGARMAEIARRAKMAEGTIYLYFPGKEALVRAVTGAFYARLTQRAAAGVEGMQDLRVQLEFLARHHLISCLGEWRIIELAAGTARTIEGYEGSEFFEYNKNYVAVFDGVFRQGVKSRELRRDVSLSHVRDLFYGGLEYACRTLMLRGHGPEDEETVTAARRLVDLVCDGVIRREGRNRISDDQVVSVTRRLERVASKLERLSG
ncbi:MAG: TetR/AcrR family transcriptional regulator [Myxococcota bacterium]